MIRSILAGGLTLSALYVLAGAPADPLPDDPITREIRHHFVRVAVTSVAAVVPVIALAWAVLTFPWELIRRRQKR